MSQRNHNNSQRAQATQDTTRYRQQEHVRDGLAVRTHHRCLLFLRQREDECDRGSDRISYGGWKIGCVVVQLGDEAVGEDRAGDAVVLEDKDE